MYFSSTNNLKFGNAYSLITFPGYKGQIFIDQIAFEVEIDGVNHEYKLDYSVIEPIINEFKSNMSKASNKKQFLKANLDKFGMDLLNKGTDITTIKSIVKQIRNK